MPVCGTPKLAFLLAFEVDDGFKPPFFFFFGAHKVEHRIIMSPKKRMNL